MQTKLLQGPHAIEEAVKILNQGGLVAFPTETVYGLGARFWDENQIQNVYSAKKRPQDNPLIVHIGKLEQLETVVKNIPPQGKKLIQTFWPGPLTLVLPKNDAVPYKVTAGRETVCVRMPAHPLARDLINTLGTPLVAPSANTSGKPSPTTAIHVLEDMDGHIEAVVDGGPCTLGIESTIVDVTQDPAVLLRPGTLSQEEIELCLGKKLRLVKENHKSKDSPEAPGMKYKHYAPKAKIHLITSWEQIPNKIANKSYILSNIQTPQKIQNAIQGDVSTQSLYHHFRAADQIKAKNIFIYIDEETAAHAGLMNRIYKAAGVTIVA